MAKMNDMWLFCKYKSESDDFLISAAKSGDGDAFRVLADRCSGIINYNMSAFSVRTSNMRSCFYSAKFDGDDLFQECCIVLFNAVKHYDWTYDVKFATYANACIKNYLISLYRKCAKGGGYITVSLNDTAAVHNLTRRGALAYEFDSDKSNMADIVYNISITAKFTALERKVFDLYLQGQSYKNISEILCKNIKSVDNAVCRIKSKLKNCNCIKN